MKAVIFDFGNVIYKFDNNRIVNGLARYTDKSPEEIRRLFYEESDLQQRYESGLISTREFYNQTTDLIDAKIGEKQFREIYTNKFWPINSTINLMQNLHPSYKLGMVSNICYIDFHYVKNQKTKFLHHMDAISISYLIKCMKPGQEIFDDILKKLKLPAEECVYIDDLVQFVKAAEMLGFKAIQYTGHRNLIKSLKDAGVYP